MTDMTKVIVLDVVTPGVTPDYCCHGKATCMAPGCGEWVWLGDGSFDLVNSGEATPFCQPCAIKYISPDAEYAGNVEDHRRSDGPHE